MAKGYQLIQTQTLTSAAASVTFSNIPQNFTDLVVKISARGNRASFPDEGVLISLNGSTSSFTQRGIEGNGAAVSTYSLGWGVSNSVANIGGLTSNSNFFSNNEVYIFDYTSGSHKNIMSDSAQENNQTTAFNSLYSLVWANNAAITSVGFTTYSTTNFFANSTFSLYGIGGTRATGGTITSDKDFTYHTFTSTSTFTALEKIKNAEMLVIAGGGGGGSRAGGGGGAGGVVYATGQTLLAGTSYTTLVGSGGTAGSRSVNGTNGGNSSFGSFVAFGGGVGGSSVAVVAGASGGSGGGGCNNGVGGSATQLSGTNYVGYGFAGGSSNSTFEGTGGGGAGGTGFNPPSDNTGGGAGRGGVGIDAFTVWANATSTGVSGYYAGGGGGGSYGSINHGLGGLGGGGNGADTSPTAGTANTGGGGGGCGNSANTNTTPVGAVGGSGLVIVRYPNT
jgi:hypothetical protein